MTIGYKKNIIKQEQNKNMAIIERKNKNGTRTEQEQNKNIVNLISKNRVK